MSDKSARAVVLRSVDLYNDHPAEVYVNPERLLEVYSEDVVLEIPGMGGAPARLVSGKEAFRASVASASSWLRNASLLVHEVVAGGAHVAARYTWTAIVTRTVPGFPAGSKVCADGADFFTVRDGLIARQVQVVGPITVQGGDVRG